MVCGAVPASDAESSGGIADSSAQGVGGDLWGGACWRGSWAPASWTPVTYICRPVPHTWALSKAR